MKPLRVAVGSLILAAGMTAAAQSFAPAAVPSPSENDAAILGTIVTGAVTDAKLCEVVIARSASADVRSYCRSTTSDDSRVALQGMQLAGRIGASDVAMQPDAQLPRLLERLERSTGREFDRSFLLTRIDYDGNVAHTLRFGAEFAIDSAVRRYDSIVMSVVLRHLESAESLLRRISESNF